METKDPPIKQDPSIAQDPPSKHKELADYFAPRYPGTDASAVHNKIISDPAAFNGALELMHKEQYGDRDFQTFRAQYVKNYGDPFSEPPAPKETKPVNPPHGGYGYSWDSGETPLAVPNYSTQEAQEAALPGKMSHDFLAYSSMKARRQQDFETTADDNRINAGERAEFIQDRIEQRSVYEFLSGKDRPGMREYEYRMSALIAETEDLDKSLDYLGAMLKAKHGEDFLEKVESRDGSMLAALAEDPMAAEWDTLVDLREKNIKRAQGLLKEDKYSAVKDYMESMEEVQSQRDASDDPIGGSANLVMRTFGKAIVGVAGLAEAGTALVTGDKEYNADNALFDIMTETGKLMQDFYPMHSKNARPMLTQTAKYKGFQVDLKDGKVQSVREADGTVSKKKFSQEEIAEMEKLEPSNQANWGAAIYKSADVIADLGVQVALTRGIVGAVSKKGMSKSRERLAARMGVTGAVMAQMTAPLYEEGQKIFDNPQEAAAFAMSTSALIGMAANLFGLESKLATGQGGFLDDMITGSVQSARMRASLGGGSWAGMSAAVGVDAMKAGLGEAFEETIMETVIERGVRGVMGAPQKSIDLREMAEKGAMGFAVGTLGILPTIPQQFKETALEIAVQNPNAYRREMARLIDQGKLPLKSEPGSPEFMAEKEQALAKEQRRMSDLAAAYEAIGSPTEKGAALGLLDKRRENAERIDKREALDLPVAELEAEQASLTAQIDRASKGAFIGALEASAPGVYETIRLAPEDIQDGAPMGEKGDALMAKLSSLEAMAATGDKRAEAALDQQLEATKRDVESSGFDLVNEKRRQLEAEGFSQDVYDVQYSALEAEAQLKGAEPPKGMKGRPPETLGEIESEAARIRAAEPKEGSPLSPVKIQRPAPKTSDDVQAAARSVAAEASLAHSAAAMLELDRRAAEQQRDEPKAAELAGRAGAIREKAEGLARESEALSKKAAAMESTGAQTYEEIQQSLRDGMGASAKKMGAVLDTGFIKFLAGVAGANAPAPMMVKAGRIWQEVRAQTVGLMPGEAKSLNNQRVGRINSSMRRAELLAKQLKSAARKAGMNMRDPATARGMNEAFSSPELTSGGEVLVNGAPLPAEVREILQEMRSTVDELSLALVQSGLADGLLLSSITENFGVYVHRSYQIHYDKDWVEKVKRDPEIWGPGLVWWKGQLSQNLTKAQEKAEKAKKKAEKLTTEASSLVGAPKTKEQLEKKAAYWEAESARLEEAAELIEVNMAAPDASLMRELDKQAMRSGGRSGKPGEKDFGIFQMKGGKAKKKAVKAAMKRIKAAEEAQFKAARKIIKATKETRTEAAMKRIKVAEKDQLKAQKAEQKAREELNEALKIDTPPELRALYGEYGSVLTNFLQTVHKQSSLLSNHQFLEEIREVGLEQGWLRVPNDPAPGFTKEIAAPEDSVMAPLNGLLTSPDLKRAFDEYSMSYNLPGWLSMPLFWSGKAKEWLTVYSPVASVRNVTQGGYFHTLAGDPMAAPAGVFMYVNGILETIGKVVPGLNYLKNSVIGGAIEAATRKLSELDKMPDLLKQMLAAPQDTIEANRAAFRVGRDAKSDIEGLDGYAELVELGLTDESVRFGLIQNAIKQYKEGFTSPYGTLSPGPALGAGREARAEAQGWAQETYQAADSAHRILRYFRDLKRYADSRGIKMEDLGVGQNMDFKREVAEIARKTYPTYSRLPEFISKLGTNPLLGPFISFHYTAAEAGVNNLVQAYKDFKAGDKTIGTSRVIGVLGANAAYSAAVHALGGLVMTGIGAAAGGLEDENTDNHKWAHHVAPWSENSKLSIFVGENGKFKYLDHGQQIPNTAIYGMMSSALAGDFERAEKILEKEIVGPFVSSEIFLKAAAESVLNQKDFKDNKKVYQEEDTKLTKAWKGIAHVADRIQPGVTSTLMRLVKAGQNEMGQPSYEDFKDYSLAVESFAVASGVRVSNGDALVSFGFKMRDLSSAMNSGLYEYRQHAGNLAKSFPNMTKEQRLSKLPEAKERAIKLATKSVEKAIVQYRATLATGVPRDMLEASFKKSGFAGPTREGIKMGRVVLPELDNVK